MATYEEKPKRGHEVIEKRVKISWLEALFYSVLYFGGLRVLVLWVIVPIIESITQAKLPDDVAFNAWVYICIIILAARSFRQN